MLAYLLLPLAGLRVLAKTARKPPLSDTLLWASAPVQDRSDTFQKGLTCFRNNRVVRPKIRVLKRSV